MSSSSEEELDELLRRQVVRRPRNFEERRLFDIENPREFREKFRLPVDAFVHLLELRGPRLEHRTRRNRPLIIIIQIFTQDNTSVHCTVINGVLHIELN